MLAPLVYCAGPISEALGALTSLEFVDIGGNELTGDSAYSMQCSL